MFRFRLAAILQLRVAVEETRKRALAEALGERDAVLRRRSGLEAERDRCRERLIREGAGVPFVERSLYGGYLDRLARRTADIAEEQKRVEARVETRRAELAAAARDRQAMERLRDRQAEAWRRERERRERIQLDELAVVGFGRRRSEEETPDAT